MSNNEIDFDPSEFGIRKSKFTAYQLLGNKQTFNDSNDTKQETQQLNNKSNSSKQSRNVRTKKNELKKHRKKTEYQLQKEKQYHFEKGMHYIEENVYVCKRPAPLGPEEIQYCDCKPGETCGESCVNRILCQECLIGHCPCGDKCTNNQFQKKNWVKVEVRKAGRKGSGLFALQDIKKGEFVIEYVGEILNDRQLRKRMEKSGGDKHFYFLTLTSNQIIDASKKGNAARFMNHSCEPNCEMQKWSVGSEIRAGLFALKDIPIGTELTFDYAFECYGTMSQKCFCESEKCRGTIIRAKPITVKTPKELQAAANRRRYERLRSYTAQTLRILSESDRHIKSSHKYAIESKLFLMRNVRRMMKVRREEQKRIYELIQEAVMPKRDEFGLLPWQRMDMIRKYNMIQTTNSTSTSSESIQEESISTENVEISNGIGNGDLELEIGLRKSKYQAMLKSKEMSLLKVYKKKTTKRKKRSPSKTEKLEENNDSSKNRKRTRINKKTEQQSHKEQPRKKRKTGKKKKQENQNGKVEIQQNGAILEKISNNLESTVEKNNEANNDDFDPTAFGIRASKVKAYKHMINTNKIEYPKHEEKKLNENKLEQQDTQIIQQDATMSTK